MRRRRKRQRTKAVAASIEPPAVTRRGAAATLRPLIARLRAADRGPLGIALAVVLFAGMGDAAPAKKHAHARPHVAVATPAPTPIAHVVETPVAADPPSWAAALKPVTVTNRNNNVHQDLRLYSDHGSLELPAMKDFMRLAESVPQPDKENGEVAEPLAPRLVQLAFRASYHFGGAAITLVSATRKGAQGKHGTGDALDFQLEGVSAADLAAFVRTFPRAGIGIYTHPKTQYVHVDVREHSYHWVDASPPGVTWREQLLPDPKQEDRDSSYAGSLDLPEAASF